MPSFKDTSGREWQVTLSVDTVSHIRCETGINLNDAFSLDSAGNTPVAKLASDPELLVAVLYAACEKQVRERNLGPRDFAAMFDGDTVETSIAALTEALCDFSPKRVRGLMHQARRKIEERIARNRPSEAELDRLIDQALPTNSAARNTSAAQSTNSLAS